MKNLFEPGTVQEVMSRIEQLQPLWEVASGKFVAKRTLLGRIVGPRVRHVLTDDSPFPRNSPTAKEFYGEWISNEEIF